MGRFQNKALGQGVRGDSGRKDEVVYLADGDAEVVRYSFTAHGSPVDVSFYSDEDATTQIGSTITVNTWDGEVSATDPGISSSGNPLLMKVEFESNADASHYLDADVTVITDRQRDGSQFIPESDSSTYPATSEVVLRSGASLWIPPAGIEDIDGSGGPTKDGTGSPSYTPAWLLDDTGAAERVAGTIIVPDWMDDFHVDLHLSNHSTGSGDAHIQVNYQLLDVDAEITGGTSDTFEWTAGSQNVPEVVRAITNLGSGAAGGQRFRFRIWRRGGDAADTLANSIALLGVEIVNAA